LKRVFRRSLFLQDLAEELTWLREKAGPEVAEAWYQSLLATIRQLRQNPFIGRQRNDLSPPGIRSLRISGFPRWLIFYEVGAEGELVLCRVRQGTMNLVVLRMES
jgi:plasmid stabilization system protein ParE